MENEELNKIIEEIDFEEKWLKYVKTEKGSISITEIEIAMRGIRKVVSDLKGENNGTDN